MSNENSDSLDVSYGERFLDLVASGDYVPLMEEAFATLRDAMLRGLSADDAIAVAVKGPADKFYLPTAEIKSDLEMMFHNIMDIGVADYAIACGRERDFKLVEYSLAAALKGGGRPPKEWSTGSLNWAFQDTARDSYDPRYVRDIEAINPVWIVTAAERDAFKYWSGSYSRVEDKSEDDLRAELSEVYAEHYEHREDVGFAEMVRMFADDDFYNHHYVARRYLACGHDLDKSMMAAGI